MKKNKMLIGIVITFTMPFFLLNSIISYADSEWDLYNQYTSSMDIGADNYIRWGDDSNAGVTPSKFDSFGLELTVDEASISAQWLDLYFTVPREVIEDRGIDKFFVLANGKIVDEVYVQYYTDEAGKMQVKGFYNAKPSIPELIGTNVYFQILGVQEAFYKNIPHYYVTAWSQQSPTVQMDPLLVKDEEAISALWSIWEKIKEMIAEIGKLKTLLEKISLQIETMFTPTEEAQQRLENATQSVLDKTPMKELGDNLNDMGNMFENTPTDSAYSKLEFGAQRDWLGTGHEFYLLDLTALEEQVRLIRGLLEAMIWIEFFIWILFYLMPKLDI